MGFSFLAGFCFSVLLPLSDILQPGLCLVVVVDGTACRWVVFLGFFFPGLEDVDI